MTKISIDEKLCVKCGTCVLACPYRLLAQVNKELPPSAQDSGACADCGHCVAVCPAGAVSHRDFPAGRVSPIDRSLLPTAEQVLNLLRARRTIRAFKDQPVEKELLTRVVDAANRGPTPHNFHRVEYLVVRDRAIIEKLSGVLAEIYGRMIYLLKNPAALSGLPEPVRGRIEAARPMLDMGEQILGRIKARDDLLQRGAPSLLVLHAPKDRGEFWSPIIDATIAIQNASLACYSLELDSCELGYAEIVAQNPQLQDLLGIPADHKVYGILAIGYPKYKFGKWIEKPITKIEWK
ncbi:MAG TPA: nitroreductase family protein [Methanocella sp.]|nr:nitroreductase family protein [Methanocella sp.]